MARMATARAKVRPQHSQEMGSCRRNHSKFWGKPSFPMERNQM